MAQFSTWRVRFHLEAADGRPTGSPNIAFIGIAGSRGDQFSPSVTSALAAAITTNLLSILQAMGYAGGTPGGTVVVDSYDHASVPDIWT